MEKDNLFISNVLAIANIQSVVKTAITKLGLEYITPMDEAIQNEKISKAINQNLKNKEQ